MNTVQEAAAADEAGPLSEDLRENEMTDVIPSTGTATLGLSDHELSMFDVIFYGKIEILSNDVRVVEIFLLCCYYLSYLYKIELCSRNNCNIFLLY
jgi:hypothetical protein